MKIINEKGKLFGIINVIDLLVLLVILGAAAGIIWKFAGNRVQTAISDNMEITYTVHVTGADKDAFESVGQHLPDRLMASGRYLNGNVIGAEALPSSVLIVSLDGVKFEANPDSMVDIIFTIQATVPKASIDMGVGTQEVRVGKTHTVKTRHIEFIGTITSVEFPES